ncbi:MAG TPA: HDOD domain-containing protein [Cellvibrio sp.]|nr:HDOD domain-containing protein [Cellvibrio sp.]
MNEIRGLHAWMRILANQDLPTLSAVVKDICSLSDNDECRADDLTKIILRDADLTSKVLKISNSIHYNRSFTPIRTVSRAIVQLGFNNLKSITLATTLIDSFLKGKPREQLIQCLAKSFHAAVQAKALVPYLDAEHQEQVFIAALLRNIGELALLSCGRSAVEAFVVARDLNPENEQEISQEHLGVDIRLINKHLIKEWALGDLTHDSVQDSALANNMIRAINIGNELSRYIHKGSSSAEMQRIYAQVGLLCDIPIEAAKKQVAQMAEEAAVIAKSYGAEMLLTAMPSADSDEVPAAEAAPTGYVLQQHLNQILKLMFEGGDLSKIMQCSVTALYEGSSLARVTIAMLDYKAKCMDVRYISGKGTSVWREQVRIELDKLHKGELLHDFLRLQQPIWYQPAQGIKPLGALAILINKGDLMLAPLKIDKRLIAILYADNAGSSLSPRQFEDFQLIANQLNLFLRVSAQPNKAQ